METVTVVAEIPSDDSLAILLDRLKNDSDPAVRAAAAAALGEYHDRRAIQGLLAGLTENEFAVSYQAKKSLNRLTGKDFGYDKSAWQGWLKSTSNVFGDDTDQLE